MLVRRGFAAGAWWAAGQADASGRLKDVGGKRAAVHIKLDTQVSRVGNPGNLVTRIQHHRLWDQSYEYKAFRHLFFHPKAISSLSSLKVCGTNSYRNRCSSDNNTTPAPHSCSLVTALATQIIQ